jgi:dihydrofolate synthase / folylpolyglutamate synthase
MHQQSKKLTMPTQAEMKWRDYNARIDWLQSLITDKTGMRYFVERDPQEQLRQFQEALVRTAEFLEFAGNPQERFPSVHVAGTSGKGSVVTMSASLLSEAGHSTAYHVSPYLQVCNEKLVLNGHMISLDGFIKLVDEFRSIYETWQTAGRKFNSLKFNEAWTSLTYLWFARCGAEWTVMETGVGGRYDPSNVLPSQLAVITNVDYDHVKPLGPELEDIARHKAGIIKPGKPVITAALNPVVLQEIEREAELKKSPLYRLGKEFDFTLHEADASGVTLSIHTPFNSFENVHVALRGAFQATNVALAVSAVDVLAQSYPIQLTQLVVESALQQVQFPGRFETIQTDPLVILDSAHNPHKMQSLVEALRSIYPHRRVIAVTGMLMTKDASSMLKLLLPAVDKLILAKPNVLGKPSLEPEQLAATIRELDPSKETHVAATLVDAIKTALAQASEGDLVLVTGSLYLVGEARNYWVSPQVLLGMA